MLARRTIAKYREELKIPTSNQRKVLLAASPQLSAVSSRDDALPLTAR